MPPRKHKSTLGKKNTVFQPIRYHGNYCGPGWSAGKWQDSVCSDVPPIDDFDRTCKDHDCSYHRGVNLKAADYKFYKQNVGKGLKRTLAAVAVGAQGYFRSPNKRIKLDKQE